MIEIRNLCYSYTDTPVLTDINLSADVGEIIGILGNNGSGKSTLIKCINRINTPKSGSIFLNKENLLSLNDRELAQKIAYVPQFGDMNHTTVFDSILLGRKPYMKWAPTHHDLEKTGEIIELMGLSKLKLSYLDELSGGERQKVILARTLVQNPMVLLLDEPTSCLDPKNQHEMLALIKNEAVKNSITVLMVIHDLNLALKYCSRLYFLKSGTGYHYCDSSSITEDVIKGVYEINANIIDHDGRKIVVMG